MVSLDDPDANAEFAKSLAAGLPGGIAHDGQLGPEYGVVTLGGLYARRWTFYIDVDGRVAAIDKSVSPATAGADVVRKLEELGFPKRDG